MVTYYDIIIASISLTAIRTLPILVPDVGASGHIPLSCSCTFSFTWTSLWYVILFLSTLGPIRWAAPLNLSQTNILIIFASHNSFYTFLVIVFLVVAHITFQSKYWKNKFIYLSITYHQTTRVKVMHCLIYNLTNNYWNSQ